MDLYNGGDANGLPLVDSGLFYKNAKGKKLSRLNAWESKETNISFNGGNVGIGTDHPQTALDVNGGVRVGRFTTSTRPACNDNIVGTFIFDTEKKKPFVCDGSVWKPLDSDYDEDGIVDWNDKDDNNPQAKHDNLTSDNIKKGVEVFGVTGSYTDDANAVASDVKTGKTFYAKGQKTVGTMSVYSSDQLATTINNHSGGKLSFGIQTGFYKENFNIFAADKNFISENIKSGVSIFGLTGQYESSFEINNEILIPLTDSKTFCCLSNKNLYISTITTQFSIDDKHYFISIVYSREHTKQNHPDCWGCYQSKVFTSIGVFDKQKKILNSYESNSERFYTENNPSNLNIRVCDKIISFQYISEFYFYYNCNDNVFGYSTDNTLNPCSNPAPANTKLLFNKKTWEVYYDWERFDLDCESYYFRNFIKIY